MRIKGRCGELAGSGDGLSPGTHRPGKYFPEWCDYGNETRRRSKCKFDEIVAFAEAEKFLDTPVKRYSSGMYVRLAFAVAAHLEPEILIVDEVLAVGDAQFQRKCLGKMGEVAKGGRTVLFVSHQLAAVRRFCSRGLLLASGRLAFDGPAPSAIDEYIKTLSESQVEQTLDQRKDREGSGRVRFQKSALQTQTASGKTAFLLATPCTSGFGHSNLTGKDIQNVSFHVAFDSPVFGRVFMCQSNLVGKKR